jgi:TPR repeat protein
MVWLIVAGVLTICVICFGTIIASKLKAKNTIESHQQPDGSLSDKNTPLEVLQDRATKGNPLAQLFLGWRYYNGEGVATNRAEASNLWAKAAEQDNTSAMVALGDAAHEKWENENAGFWATNPPQFDTNTGLPIVTAPAASTNSPNYIDSVGWYERAAKQGDTNAMWRIVSSGGVNGEAFDPLTGLPTLTADGLPWLQRLADNGDSAAN